MRPGQHNKRGRNRHRSGGGGSSGSGGGNPLSRVYESNGPDVKVRGTAQTVAEKYLQLGRDAQSAGDNVMAESYYQHAEHYLRIVAAAQAYQQQMQPQQYRRPGEDFDEDEGDEPPDGASVEPRSAPTQGEQPDINGDQLFEGERQAQPQQQYRQPRDNRERGDRDRNRERDDRDQNVPRDQLPPQFGGGRDRDRGRPRWQDRREPPQSYEPRQPQPRSDEAPRERAEASEPPASDQWEAPSFLRRPAPLPATEAAETADTAAVAPAPERKPRGRPRRERPAEDTTAPEAAEKTE